MRNLSEKLMTQVKLVTADGDTMTTWVDDHPQLKEGATIELKKDKREWLVLKVYATHPMKDINEQKWDNNI